LWFAVTHNPTAEWLGRQRMFRSASRRSQFEKQSNGSQAHVCRPRRWEVGMGEALGGSYFCACPQQLPSRGPKRQPSRPQSDLQQSACRSRRGHKARPSCLPDHAPYRLFYPAPIIPQPVPMLLSAFRPKTSIDFACVSAELSAGCSGGLLYGGFQRFGDVWRFPQTWPPFAMNRSYASPGSSPSSSSIGCAGQASKALARSPVGSIGRAKRWMPINPSNRHRRLAMRPYWARSTGWPADRRASRASHSTSSVDTRLMTDACASLKVSAHGTKPSGEISP